MKYTYSFRLWPAHGTTFSTMINKCFDLYPALAFDFTEDEFDTFRSDLLTDGFELHEVERIPYHEPETVL